MVDNVKKGAKDWAEVAQREIEEAADASQEDAVAVPEDDAIPATENLSQADLEIALEKEKQAHQQVREQLLRVSADYQNFQGRHTRELEKAHKFAFEKFANELLPIVDSFEHCLSAIPADNDALTATREGVEMTYKLFLDVLTKHEIEQIDPQGEVFDPAKHEAMTTQISEDAAAGTVLAVVQKGYVLHQRVIRPARVIVAKSNG